MTNHFYQKSIDEVLKFFSSNSDTGLSEEQVNANKIRYGINKLTPHKEKSGWIRFLLQIHQPLIYVLILSATLALFFGEYIDASVIYGVVIINAIMGFYQEDKAIKKLSELSSGLNTFSTVIRNGSKQIINSNELVPGDIVLLYAGDKIGADMRIIQAQNLKVDEANLTGESVAVFKQAVNIKENTLLADRTNMLYASTFVTYGTAKAVVVEIGDKTEIGRISNLLNKTPDLKTPLTIQIEKFSQKLLWFIVGISALSFLVGWIRGYNLIEVFMSAVSMAVAAIPEGLPATITIILSIGVNRMAKSNAIVRKLPSVETLGCTSVICSDKTGTLTENKMTVQRIFSGNTLYSVSGSGYSSTGLIEPIHDHNIALKSCLECGVLCNTAIWTPHKQSGDPTEIALLVSAEKYQIDTTSLSNRKKEVYEIPFDSSYQYMASLRSDQTIYIKGSLESILSRCDQIMTSDGELKKINKTEITEQMETMARNGLRVLAFAIKPDFTKDIIKHEDIKDGLIFLGLQAMIDPPRQDAITAISTCHRAGISVKMITGDHMITAKAIAMQMNLNGKGLDELPVVMDGREISEASDKELQEIVKKTDIFARISPEDKLRLVRAIQKNKNIVAMTGDGVNDAPALKQANIGISMGITGTEVAKDSSDIVLTDDNFTTIEKAIEHGRGIFDNLIKFILWTLPTSFAEAFIVMIAILLGLQLPILPVQILWINMVTTIFLGMMFSFEPIEKDIMSRKPRSASIPIITRPILLRMINMTLIITFICFIGFYQSLNISYNLEQSRTFIVNLIVFIGILFMFSCRSWETSIFKTSLTQNKPMLWGTIGMIVLQIIFTYTSLFQLLFKTSALTICHWGYILILSLIVLSIIEIEKLIIRHKNR